MASCNDMAACPRSDAQSQPQTQQQQQREVRLETDEYFFRRGQTVRLSRSSSPERSSSRYQRLQFRRMYRYGLSLLLVGALCNWIGFVQHYFAPIRYLGVGCVIAGALCICIALGRWLSLRSHDSSANQEISSCGTVPSIHVIAVPVQSADPFQMQQQPMTSKPPDYETAIGSKPPSYDEAIRISPVAFLPPPPPLPLNTEVQTSPVVPAPCSQQERVATTNSSPIDCTR